MLSSFTTVDYFFLFCAVVGGLLFLVRLGFGLFGGDAGDFDGDAGQGLEHPAGDLSGDHPGDAGFKLFSIQGITGFFIMFGLVGLALSRAGSQVFWSAAGGVLAGSVTMLLIAWIFYSMQRLQSDGTLRISNAIGKDGIVYLTIPENGTGQISLVVQGRLHQFDAVSSDGRRIQTGDKVHVVRVVSSSVLVVEPLDPTHT